MRTKFAGLEPFPLPLNGKKSLLVADGNHTPAATTVPVANRIKSLLVANGNYRQDGEECMRARFAGLEPLSLPLNRKMSLLLVDGNYTQAATAVLAASKTKSLLVANENYRSAVEERIRTRFAGVEPCPVPLNRKMK